MSKQVIADLTALVNDLQSEITSLQSSILALQTSIANIQSDVSTLKAQVAQLLAGTPPTPSAPPLLQGWGGIFADGYQGYQGTGTDPSNVQANLDVMVPRGYNGFRCMIYNADFNHTCSITDIVNAVNVAKQNNVWIILDYHGYTEPFTDLAGWLAFWKQVIQAVSGLYDKIVYEPCNEPNSSDQMVFANAYQQWISQCRSLGDTHWIIVSVNCYNYDGQVVFPTVTDPLKQLFASWHGYFTYKWNSSNWNTAGAQAYADTVAGYATKASAIGVPFMSEFGADSGGSLAPDNVIDGSAGYSPEGIGFVTELINKLSSQGFGYMLWTAGGWTNTSGAGATGALNIWGNQIPTPSGTPSSPPPTYRLEAPPGTTIIQTTTLAICQTAILSLPQNTTWQIIDSNNTVVSSGITGITPPPTPTGTVDQIVMVVLENTDISSSLAEPFLAQFASQNALSTQWRFIGHPSEPNYIAIAFGDTFGVNSDGDSTTRPPPTILDLVRASGRTYRIIQNGSRGFDHNGFLLESPDISNTVAGDTPDVIAAVQQGVNFVWFTPSDNQNGHDNGIASASQWLSTWVPSLLTAMAPRNSLLIITTDENTSFVYTVFAGPAAKKGYSSNKSYDHYSFGRLIETLWGGTGLRNCDTANDPSEFLF